MNTSNKNTSNMNASDMNASDTAATTLGKRFSEIARSSLHERSWVTQPAVSPDGTRVAAVINTIDLDENTTRSRIWLDGAIISAGPNDASPTWSPDGRSLAFTSRRGTDAKPVTLHVIPVDGPGEVREVCAMPDGLGGLAWSPDGTTIAFVSRTRDERYDAKDVSWQSPRKIERFLSRLNGEDWVFDRPQHIYVVAVDGTGGPRNLTPGEFAFWSPSWLADSSGVVVAGTASDDWDRTFAVDIYVVTLDGGRRALTAQTGIYDLPSVSPDGTWVAVLGHERPMEMSQNTKVGLLAIDGGPAVPRWITGDLDRTFYNTVGTVAPVWESGTTILASAEDRGDTHLYRLSLTAEPILVADGRHAVSAVSAGEATVAITKSVVERPAELFVSRDGNEFAQVTNVTRSGLSWEKFAVPCADGNGEIDAWVMRPADFDDAATYPVLLNVHGGPFTQYGETYHDEAQMQAAAGFVVVMSNPRGGSGRDTSWGQAINGPHHPTAPGLGWGTVDVDDVVAVIDATLDRYRFCDRDRVGMLGGSYGGYMATTLAARFGDRFRAICSERSVNNLVTEEWESDIATAFIAEHGVSVVENPDEYWERSPVRLARDIDTPMLLIHSELDWRCPIGQAEELWVTLKLLGKDVTFYRFPGENHELSRSGSPVHRRMRAEIILGWFAERLGLDQEGTAGPAAT